MNNEVITLIQNHFSYMMLCAIRYHLCNLKNVKTPREECFFQLQRSRSLCVQQLYIPHYVLQPCLCLKIALKKIKQIDKNTYVEENKENKSILIQFFSLIFFLSIKHMLLKLDLKKYSQVKYDKQIHPLQLHFTPTSSSWTLQLLSSLQ